MRMCHHPRKARASVPTEVQQMLTKVQQATQEVPMRRYVHMLPHCPCDCDPSWIIHQLSCKLEVQNQLLKSLIPLLERLVETPGQGRI